MIIVKSTLAHFDPLAEMRAIDSLFDRMFVTAPRTVAQVANAAMPIGIFEKDGKIIIRASVPGIAPEDIDISIESNVLTISGEFRQEGDLEDAKVYRREYAQGTFSRSVRLSERLDFEKIDAEFANGFVTITIPTLEEPRAKTVKVPLRAGTQGTLTEKAEGGTKKGEVHKN